jgi:hypothetical protein
MGGLDQALKNLEGDAARLRFTDGEEIVARLISVDLEEHRDVIFDLVRVITPGPGSRYEGKAAYVATIDTIASVVREPQ